MSTLRRRVRWYAVGAALAVPLVAGAFVWQHPALLTAAELFDQVLHTLADAHVDALPLDSLYLRAARGLVHELHDPYTELFTPVEEAQFESTLNSSVSGIGVSIGVDPSGTYLRTVFPGAPAAAAGLQIGDRILQVDTMQYQAGMTTQQVAGHIMGPVGTPVHLTLVREQLGHSHADTMHFTVTRAPVHFPAVPFTLLLDGHVGYFSLRQFSQGAADEVRAAIDTLRRAGATKFILDLRSNPGGLTDQAVALCGLFLPQGQVVIRLRNVGGERAQETQTPPAVPTQPLVVLVDPHTASAAEVTSGALQDHDRAVVIGRPTYGKGVAQQRFPMPGGYTLKVTTERWYTPIGRSVQRERKLLPSGEYGEVHPESLETDAERRARPTYKSDAGRMLYGGGSIVPDLVVHDTVGAAGALFFATLKTDVTIGRMQSMLSSYAASLAQTTPRPVHVTPAMRTAFVHQLRLIGITLPRTVLTKTAPFIDRLIAERIALLQGDAAAAKRLGLGNDAPLTQALTVLQQADDQTSLFTAVKKHTGETL